MPDRVLGRDFVLLWQGQLASSLGNQAFVVAAMSWLLEATSSPGLMGLWLMTSALPAVIFGPFAGALADRHSRRTLIVLSDLTRGVAHVGLAVVMVLSPDATDTIVALFLALGCLSGALGTLVSPALAAAIPEMVPPTKLAVANSLHQISTHAATVVGQAAGGVLYVWVGASGLVLFDGITFVASAACARLARSSAACVRTPVSAPGLLRAYASDVRVGITWLWAKPSLRDVTIAFAAANFSFTPVFVLLPLYVREVLQSGPEAYGFLLAAAGAGALGGSGLALRIRPRPTHLSRALACIALCTIALGTTRSLGLALCLLFAGGLASAIANVGVVTMLQASTPRELRGRVLAITTSLAGAAMPAGLGLGAVLGWLGGSFLPEVLSGCGAGILIIAGALARRQCKGRTC